MLAFVLFPVVIALAWVVIGYAAFLWFAFDTLLDKLGIDSELTTKNKVTFVIWVLFCWPIVHLYAGAVIDTEKMKVNVEETVTETDKEV